MVVDEAQRCADREGVQPQRNLGQFHRHRVFVRAIDTALEHHALDQLGIVQLLFAYCPAFIARMAPNGPAHLADFFRHRAFIIVQPGSFASQYARFLDCLQSKVRQPINQRNKEMPGPHRRVANPQPGDRFRRVGLLQPVQLVFLAVAPFELA